MSDIEEKTAKVYFWDNILLAIPAILIVAFFLLYKPCDQVCSDWDFVRDLLLDDGDSETIIRWTFAPTVRAVNGSPEEISMLDDAVSKYSEFLSGTGYSPIFTHESTADIEVNFAVREKHKPIVDLETTDGYAQWDYDNEIRRYLNVEIVVFDDLQPGRKWGTILHELGHGMGFIGHTDRYYSSLFHVEMGYGALSDNFSSDDRKAMRFIYEHLELGSDEESVREAFDRHWKISSE
jgi:hypothetical protein